MILSTNEVRGLLSSWWGGPSSPPSSRRRRAELSMDILEGRVVLSSFGGARQGLAARLARGGQGVQVGSLSSGGGASLRGGRGGSRGVAQDAELTTLLDAYRADVNSILLGSSATDAQRQALSNAFRAISTAGFEVDKDALAPVADSLLAALADGSLSAAEQESVQTAFNALFADSAVDETLISEAFAAFVAVADNLDIDQAELDDLNADRQAISDYYTGLGITARVPSSLDLILSGSGGPSRGRCR
jgi:hypothetical protein